MQQHLTVSWKDKVCIHLTIRSKILPFHFLGIVISMAKETYKSGTDLDKTDLMQIYTSVN